MKALGNLVAGLVMLAIVAAAGFGVWSAINPSDAKHARDRAIRSGQAILDAGKDGSSQGATEAAAEPEAARSKPKARTVLTRYYDED